MDCWICGDIADTKEHKIKASDLAQHFGVITQEDPAVRWPKDQRKQYIKSKKSPKFTFDSLICGSCNNDRTQPYDKSWESLSKYFFDNRDRHIRDGVWEPKKAFPGSSKRNMLNVHLYFIKWFGCKARDLGVNLDYSVLSNNILNSDYNSNFYLVFGNTPGLPSDMKYALETPIDVLEYGSDKNIHSAFSFYIVGQVAIKIVYTPGANFRTLVKGAWSPDDKRSKYIYFEKSDVKI